MVSGILYEMKAMHFQSAQIACINSTQCRGNASERSDFSTRSISVFVIVVRRRHASIAQRQSDDVTIAGPVAS